MSNTPKNHGEPWKREELILAFELYCRIPFKKTKANNLEVIRLANILHRTPSSVARKLGNFGAFDPYLRKNNISGLSHYSQLDEQVWNDFHENWNSLVYEAYKIRLKTSNSATNQEQIKSPGGPSERLSLTKQRVHQSFFRQTVLSNYEGRCCITGIRTPECLIASHIIPWSVDERYRTDPANGLCLSATFDKLFDHGLLGISDKYMIMVSGNLLNEDCSVTQKEFCLYNGKPILMPHRFIPSLDYIRWHTENVFVA